MLDSHAEQFHLKCYPGQLGEYCLLPGDPGRCEKIAKYFDEPEFLSSNREFTIYRGYICGERVCVCSTGIGGPSAAIAVEELAACGVKNFIRIGTCGGIDTKVRPGDIVIATGAVRQDGTSHEYAPPEFPAVADFELTSALVAAAKNLGIPSHTGIVQSKDSFYGQHSPSRMPTAGALLEKWEAWRRLHVLASEMEASTVYTVCASLGLAASSVFHVIWNQERAAQFPDEKEDHDTDRAVRCGVEALRIMISEKNTK
ncbi:MAG: uridine phosphorylase [Ruminococcaceae bacterium]|nr:uridine phosphorylase [Oscillospiraceae bacterium]